MMMPRLFVEKLTKLTVRDTGAVRFRRAATGGLVATLLLVGACRQQEPAASSEIAEAAAVTVYAGQGRDRLCLATEGGVAGFVTYAASGDSNCSVRGKWDAAGPQAIAPNGDQRCSIAFNRDGDSVTLLAGTPACAYYCGPGAAFDGRTFVRMDRPVPAADIAGDALC